VFALLLNVILPVIIKQAAGQTQDTVHTSKLCTRSSHPSLPLCLRVTDDAREDEMEENLTQVGSMLGNLKSMALDIGTELESQSDLIGRIQNKVLRSVNVTLLTQRHSRSHCVQPGFVQTGSTCERCRFPFSPLVCWQQLDSFGV